jgi:mRNA interferase MazF
MDKNQNDKYDDWNIRKQYLQETSVTDKIYFKEGDIWWCALGINIGSESFGKGHHFRRPILVIKKLSAELCIALPLTSREKEGSWFVDITLEDQKRWVMLYQIRSLHKKRFQYKIATLNDEDFRRVKEKLETLLELSENHHSANAEIEGIAPKNNDIVAEENIESQ